MAFDTRRTYLCYENKDLIRDGYIPIYSFKGYVPVSTFNINRLKNKPPGISYIIEYEKDSNGKQTSTISQIIEKKKLLPATKIKVEIDFSKVMRNAVTNPLKEGILLGTPFVSLLAGSILSPMGFGGLTSGTSEITFHILDAQTKINRIIVVDENMIKDKGWYCEDGYPLSVFGIVKEHIESVVKDGETTSTGSGLNFSKEDLEVLGKFSSGAWQGSVRKRINGATDNNGLFGGRADPEVKFDKVRYSDQQQLFVKIVRDPRLLKFRADNFDNNGDQSFPPGIDSDTAVDSCDKFIRIDTSSLAVGDNIYITYSVCKERQIRQNMVHKGTVAQGSTIGVGGFIGAIDSVVDAFDYQMCTWKTPELPFTISYYNIDTLPYTQNSQYKIPIKNYYDIVFNNKQDGFSEVTGWRVSESITTKVKKFWAADYRGIFLYEEGKPITLVLSRNNIIDQDWFDSYLQSLDFITPSGPNGDYLPRDYEKTLENNIDLKEQAGFLFDINPYVNSLLFDREKIPYYRPFANALKKVSAYNKDTQTGGIGIIHLDLLSTLPTSYQQLDFFDLSFSIFRSTNAQPTLTYQCENPFDIHAYHYSSNNYDAESNGPGTWYSADYIANKGVFEWRPGGGSIEGYWKIETPYFCGNFSKNTRIYIEKMGGNSLDNYSWIYVDTSPLIPTNISLDKDAYTGESSLVFKDDIVHDGLSYYKFTDSSYSFYYNQMKLDYSLSPVIGKFDHTKDMILGQNKLLGLFPSYSNGVPITDEINRICGVCRADSGEATSADRDNFWWDEVLFDFTDPIGINYGLSFSDTPPKASIPFDYYIHKLHIEYAYKSSQKSAPFILEDDSWVSFYFEGSDTSISNINLYSTDIDQSTGVVTQDIDMGYYHGGPIQFLGNFWKYIDVVYVYIRVTSLSDPKSLNKLDLNDYKIIEGQNAIEYDRTGRMFVFYGNSESGNIDAAVSMNGGLVWAVHKSIIRLIKGETASFPVVLKDYNAGCVHLFYILNSNFIMYKKIDTDLFDNADSFVEPKIPETYKVGDYNTTRSGSEDEWWGEFSTMGHEVRREPSYFIVGSSEDTYFIEEMKITSDLKASNEQVVNQSLIQPPRFEYYGNLSDLDDKEYNGANSFAVHMDNSGVTRLFYTSLIGNLSIKRSNDYFTWSYDIKDQEIHRIFKYDKQNEGVSSEIQNIQIVKDNYDPLNISLLYFNNGMFFIRHFDSNLLFSQYDPDGNKNNNQMKKELELVGDSVNKPIFLVGDMLPEVKNIKIQEIDNNVSEEDSELLIKILYGKDRLDLFNEQLAIDSFTQPVGVVLDNGLIRIFYRDNYGSIRSLSVNKMEQPLLEMFWIKK